MIMPIELLAAVATSTIAAVASVVVAVVNRRALRESERYRAERRYDEERRRDLEEHRRAMDEAMYAGMLAMLEAQDVALTALQGGHLNGNVEDARRRVAKARESFSSTRDSIISSLLG